MTKNFFIIFIGLITFTFSIEFDPETGQLIKSKSNSKSTDYFDPNTGELKSPDSISEKINKNKYFSYLTIYDADRLGESQAKNRFEKLIWTYGGGSVSLISNVYSLIAVTVMTEGVLTLPAIGLGAFAYPYIYSEFMPINIPQHQKLLLGIDLMDNSENSLTLINTFNESYIKETKKLRRETIFWGQSATIGAMFIGGFFISFLGS